MENKKEKIKWYESGNVITNFIIGVILIIIVCSQSFAVASNASIDLFSSVINHNSIYLLILFYFICIKTKVGKKYFNYLNIYLGFIYFISTIASLLTVTQSLSLSTIFTFIENAILFVYILHTMFRDTRIWKEYQMGSSPFNEITNDGYYNSLLILIVLTLIINLISTVVISGLFLSILDALYILLLGRYVYLYREYLDYHQLDSKNDGNFDGIKKEIQNVLDSTTIDDKAIEIVNDIKDKATDIIDKGKDKVLSKKEEKKEKPKRGRPKKKGDDK